MDNRTKAVIDADFFRNATEYDWSTTFFLRILDEMEMQPVMHEFVAETELRQNQYLDQLLQSGRIAVVRYEDYLRDDTDKEEYKEYFLDAYERINRFVFPTDEDIYEYSDKKESLGEIRSLYMAMKKGYHYFMSDDGGSRFLAKNFFSGKHAIEVNSLYDVLVKCKERGTNLTWKDINPTVTQAMNKRQDRIEELKKRYIAGNASANCN